MKINKIIQRENNFDLLRIIATFGVISIHIGSDFNVKYSSDFGTFFNIFFKFSVPLFLMLSGAFVFKRKIEPSIFYKKAMKKLGKPLVVVSIMYMVV